MSKIYPINTVQIMSDNVFLSYGHSLDDYTTLQRNAAYFIAEENLSLHLGTLLVPTLITGTLYPYLNGMAVLEWGYVGQVYGLLVSDNYGNSQMLTDISYGLIDSDNGFFDTRAAVASFLGWSACTPCPGWHIDKYELVYQAGLPTGISMRPNMLMALTILSDIALKEMSELGLNEGVGDIGINSFSTAGYTESRVDLIRTALGTSARANYARKLVNNIKLTQALRMR